MAQNPRKGADDPAAKELQEQRAAVDKSNMEAMERMDKSKPTPTQEENDLARLGVIVDPKEDDGSGPTVITHTVVANEPLGAHGYETSHAREAREKTQREARERAEKERAEQARRPANPQQRPPV